MMTKIIPSSTQLTTKNFDASILAGQVRKSSIDLYTRDFKAYLEFAGSFDCAVQPATLAQWRTALAKGEKSPNTINRQLSSVRTLMKAAAEQGYIAHDIAEADELCKLSNLYCELEKDRSYAVEVLRPEKFDFYQKSNF